MALNIIYLYRVIVIEELIYFILVVYREKYYRRDIINIIKPINTIILVSILLTNKSIYRNINKKNLYITIIKARYSVYNNVFSIYYIR
jgi:hypothetical protein